MNSSTHCRHCLTLFLNKQSYFVCSLATLKAVLRSGCHEYCLPQPLQYYSLSLKRSTDDYAEYGNNITWPGLCFPPPRPRPSPPTTTTTPSSSFSARFQVQFVSNCHFWLLRLEDGATISLEPISFFVTKLHCFAWSWLHLRLFSQTAVYRAGAASQAGPCVRHSGLHHRGGCKKQEPGLCLW